MYLFAGAGNGGRRYCGESKVDELENRKSKASGPGLCLLIQVDPGGTAVADLGLHASFLHVHLVQSPEMSPPAPVPWRHCVPLWPRICFSEECCLRCRVGVVVVGAATQYRGGST